MTKADEQFSPRFTDQTIGVFILAALTIYLGLDASFTTSVSGEIATSLLGSEIK